MCLYECVCVNTNERKRKILFYFTPPQRRPRLDVTCQSRTSFDVLSSLDLCEFGNRESEAYLLCVPLSLCVCVCVSHSSFLSSFLFNFVSSPLSLSLSRCLSVSPEVEGEFSIRSARFIIFTAKSTHFPLILEYFQHFFQNLSN